MRNKRSYNPEMKHSGRGRRGHSWRGFGFRMAEDARPEEEQGWRFGRRWGAGPWQDFSDDATFGPPPWSMAGRMGIDVEISDDERRAWLQARKARLLAWKKHLDARLAETEQALADLDAADTETDTGQDAG